MPNYYYEPRKREDGWHGIVYHYSDDGNSEIIDFIGETRGTETEAIDDAAVYSEEHGLDTAMGVW